MSDIPEGFPEQARHLRQLDWVTSVARCIVEFAWLGPIQNEAHSATVAFKQDTNRSKPSDTHLGYCTCGSGNVHTHFTYCLLCDTKKNVFYVFYI